MKILILEDDANILSFLKRGFRENGDFVEGSMDGEEGEYLATVQTYDIIILDWMLPGQSGKKILENLRKKDIKTPVIMLTAKDAINDKVSCLRKGADDYLTKPFSFKELQARVEALYRRTIAHGNNVIMLKNISIDLDLKMVQNDNGEIKLTQKEYELLVFLIKHKNAIVSNEMIENQLWSKDSYINSNVIQVTIYHLRKKIGKELIHSFRGLGYKINVS